MVSRMIATAAPLVAGEPPDSDVLLPHRLLERINDALVSGPLHAPESLEWLDDSDGTDYAALRRGAVSVTPLRLEGMFLTGDPLALRAATEPLVRAAFGEQLDSTTRVP